MSNMAGVLYEAGTAYLSRASSRIHPRFIGVVRFAHAECFFCDYLLYVFKLRFPHKNDVRFVFTSSFLGELMSYLRCVCLFAYSCYQHILCCHLFLLLIAPPVFCNVYLLDGKHGISSYRLS
jgi:hypothetical protein